MRDQWRIADEFEQFGRAICKQRLVRKELDRKPVHGLGLGRHIAFGIVIGVEGGAGFDPVDHLDTADFNHPVPFLGV